MSKHKNADAHRNKSCDDCGGSAGDPCGGGGMAPGIGSTSHKNKSPPYARHHSSMAGVGHKQAGSKKGAS